MAEEQRSTHCQRYEECEFYHNHKDCKGCTYQHVWKILQQKRNSDLPQAVLRVITAIDDGLWNGWRKSSRSPHARRPSVDEILCPALEKNYEVYRKEKKGYTVVPIENEEVKIKHDGHFVCQGTQKEFIIEYKGYPEEGQVLGPLMAASLLKRLQPKPEFYFLCHSISKVENSMPRSWALLQFGRKKGYFDGMYGLDNIEEWLQKFKSKRKNVRLNVGIVQL